MNLGMPTGKSPGEIREFLDYPGLLKRGRGRSGMARPARYNNIEDEAGLGSKSQPREGIAR